MADIDDLVRSRLRSLRRAAGWSLDELAARSHVGASTISRIETGKRTVGLDVLVPLARALQADLDELLATDDDGDVVIRPVPDHRLGGVAWHLSRPGSSLVALKMRMEPDDERPAQQVHPGHDWFFVLDGAIRLYLGDREIVVERGEAAEFSTMTPHAFVATGGPAEILMVFDRDGERAHLHT